MWWFYVYIRPSIKKIARSSQHFLFADAWCAIGKTNLVSSRKYCLGRWGPGYWTGTINKQNSLHHHYHQQQHIPYPTSKMPFLHMSHDCRYVWITFICKNIIQKNQKKKHCQWSRINVYSMNRKVDIISARNCPYI